MELAWWYKPEKGKFPFVLGLKMRCEDGGGFLQGMEQ